MIDVFAIVEDLARRRRVEPGRISLIELNRSTGTRSAVALLAFEDGGAEPVAFLKATTDATRAGQLQREFENLTRLANGPDAFRGTVPRPLYCERLGASTVLAESARAGTRIKDYPPDGYFASRRFRHDYSSCTQWLLELHETLCDPAGRMPAVAARSAVDRYRRSYEASPALDQLLSESVHELERVSVPGVPSHGDFCTANVLVRDDGGLFVVDWEYPLDPTWPLADLLYFTTSTWCVPYRKGRAAVEENLRRLFFEPHGFSDLIREAVLRTVERLALSRTLMLPLSALCWTSFANRKHDELAGGARRDTGHLPLILVRDGRCVNLELLAQRRDRYLLRTAAEG